MSKKADIIAVAKRAGVSISTVSRSFNHPDLVKPATRKKIDSAVRRLGYIRNRAAQTMHGIRSGTIGLVVPTIDNAIFAELIQTFSEAVEAEGFTILVASHGYNLEREYAVLRKFLEHRVDAVALIGHDHSEESYQLIERQTIQAISIWNYDPASRLPCVGADNHEAGRLAARHVINQGHREIGLVFPPTRGNDRAADRLNGANLELANAGVEVPETWRIQALYSVAETKRAVSDLIGSAHRPTALICGNDVVSLGCIYAAKAHGLKVPEEISVMGIGDFKSLRGMEPGLSTIHLPAHQIGRLAGARIADAIIHSKAETYHEKCAIHLEARDTVFALGSG